MRLHARAPAKINLGLFVGGLREDGRHELVSTMQSISLCDELTLTVGEDGDPAVSPAATAPPGAGTAAPAADTVVSPTATAPGGDTVICAGVDGPNLALDALDAFRAATGWDAPPVTLRIDKRVPVAAGLGGGSADAACALRLAAAASGLGDDGLLLSLAARLGADVPAQVRPGRFLATGAGERIEPLVRPDEPLRVVVVPSAQALSTAAVYARFDDLGCLRDADELAAVAARMRAGEVLLDNDLQAAACELCPGIADALRAVGGDAALVSGSGPTVLGLFRGDDAQARAGAAAAALHDLGAIVAEPVDAEFGRVSPG